ncbi:MAG: A/G-specific adenine glycosylase [Spirochaetes bacterium]|nr:A/G-specific adenine glycosylase [Spirochaetota bacterium]MBU1080537.1 A/G-specific adenine glycosylase [Spirochaetota bacterium]
MISDSDAAEFRAAVLDLYAREGRRFPWRETRDPWAIFVSEIMLQQTQTARVEPKYRAWMELFPDAETLAAAELSSVYEAWRGLGYNSRALRLRESARVCASRHEGLPPRDESLLLELPGVGRYTARAVLAFAYGRPSAFLETNIRAALLFHFFKGRSKVPDRELEAVAEAVLDNDDPRSWYYALMDYGSWLKKREPNPTRGAAAYSRQSKFEGSLRQARGALLRAVADAGVVDLGLMAAERGLDYGRLESAARGLEADGLVRLEDGEVRFAD